MPTDCPTRERMGWTGDSQVFFNTASYLTDYAAFARKHVRDIFDRQWRSGRLPQIAPFANESPSINKMNGSVGWACAGVYIPYYFYQKYGDDRLLRAYYDNMLRYADFVIRRAGKWGGIFAKPMHLSHKNRKYAVNCGKSYGEWAEPNDVMAFHGIDFFHSAPGGIHGLYILRSSVCWRSPRSSASRKRRSWRASGNTARARTRLSGTRYEGRLLAGYRPAGQARPALVYGAADAGAGGLCQKAPHRRAGPLWLASRDRLPLTPMILDVLAGLDISYAYRLLENEEMPGWLFMPKSGATTIWEAWEGNQKDKWIASLNHYSKGAVCEWLMNTMCGIRITGENHVTIAPKPGGDITFARASYWSICGNVTTSWERTENGYRLTVGIPANTTAEILLPDGTGRTVGAGQHRYEWK